MAKINGMAAHVCGGLNRLWEYWDVFKGKFRLDPLTKKRLDRFSEIKRAKISLIVIGTFFFLSLIAEVFVSNRPLIMRVDGKLYFPAYGRVLLAQDFNFRVSDELEIHYREFAKHLKETKRGWALMPFIPYNPFESDNSRAPLSKTFVGAPILGLATDTIGAPKKELAEDFIWVGLGTTGGVKMPDGKYVWVKYADASLSAASMTDFPSKKKNRIGIAADKTVAAESVNPADYTWHEVGLSDNIIDMGNGRAVFIAYAKGEKGQMFHPLPPSLKTRHILGTDRIGRDVFARLFYGFRIAMSFSLLVALASYCIGVTVGIAMGYFGGLFDTVSQRFIEIWERIPYLYMIMILSAVFKPTFLLFVLINIAFTWTGKTWNMRAMTYRERERDYILAARSMGAGAWRIMTVHILPNVIVIIVTSLPFVISGGIGTLTALDYLGYGLQPPTPSWGELLSVGTETYAESPWILSSAVAGFVFVLVMITFVGEGLRDAFDPRRFTVYK